METATGSPPAQPYPPEPRSSEGILVQARAAVDYRGDVTIELRDGTRVVGFAFDLTKDVESPETALRLLDPESGARRSVRLSDMGSISLSGKDAASGKTWENWVRRYAEKKLAGEAASIDSEPLDGRP